MSSKDSNNSGTGIFSVLFVVFLVLKLTGVIAWSWWWVTAPIWGGAALIFLLGFLVIIFSDH